MATKTTPKLEPRISICASSPFNFFAQLKEAFAQGYEWDHNGYVVLNTPCQYIVEMILPEGNQ